MNKIIVPIDFTKAAAKAADQAVHLAMRTHADIVLLHVADDKAASFEEAERNLVTQSEKISAGSGLKCDYILQKGNVFTVIANEISKTAYDIMVIGTHGIKGVRQIIFGADMFKLISKVSIPVLVVQEDTPPVKVFTKLILPVSSHEAYSVIVDAVISLATICNAEVHLYSINKPGFEWPEQMKKNIKMALDAFTKKGIQALRAQEDQIVYSVGYAKQTLDYANAVKADCLCMISSSSEEYYYFAQADKELMLENDYRIPVLFASGKEE